MTNPYLAPDPIVEEAVKNHKAGKKTALNLTYVFLGLSVSAIIIALWIQNYELKQQVERNNK